MPLSRDESGALGAYAEEIRRAERASSSGEQVQAESCSRRTSLSRAGLRTRSKQRQASTALTSPSRPPVLRRSSMTVASCRRACCSRVLCNRRSAVRPTAGLMLHTSDPSRGAEQRRSMLNHTSSRTPSPRSASQPGPSTGRRRCDVATARIQYIAFAHRPTAASCLCISAAAVASFAESRASRARWS